MHFTFQTVEDEIQKMVDTDINLGTVNLTKNLLDELETFSQSGIADIKFDQYEQQVCLNFFYFSLATPARLRVYCAKFIYGGRKILLRILNGMCPVATLRRYRAVFSHSDKNAIPLFFVLCYLMYI